MNIHHRLQQLDKENIQKTTNKSFNGKIIILI